MRNIFRQYYQGITQQIRSEVDFINSLFEHQGLKGEGNEAALRELLTKFIPKRYGVGTGVVIDRHGNPSKQCDIVIYDTFLYPSLLSLTSVHLFPVDLVYATIEIKTTLTSQTAKEALENIASVRKLDYIRSEFGDQWPDGDSQVFGFRKTTPPIGVIFAYNSKAKQGNTFKSWFTPPSDEDIPLYPSLIGCLDFGLIGFHNPSIPESTSVIELDPAVGMKPELSIFPIARRKGNAEEITTIDDIQYLKVNSPQSDKLFVEYEGTLHPIKRAKENYVAIDQSRVLLVFLLQLNGLLTLKKIDPSLNLVGTYIKHLDLFHLVL